MAEQLIDIRDLASQLKVPPKTIRNKLSNNTWPIPPIRIGRSLRWRQSDVDAFVAEHAATETDARQADATEPKVVHAELGS